MKGSVVSRDRQGASAKGHRQPGSGVIILQRGVPSYRVPLFDRLHSEYGWRVVAASDGPKEEYPDLADQQPWLTLYPFRFPTKSQFQVVVPLTQILKDTGAKAVISEFALGMSSSYQLPLLKRVAGIKVLFWSHGYNMSRGLDSIFRRLAQVPRIGLSRLVDGHICYSEEGRRFLERYLAPKRVFVARNTLDVELIRREASLVPPASAPGSPHLVTSGRLVLEKNVPMLVRIFGKFREKYPDAALTIIGDGPERASVEAEAGEALGKSVFLTGALYRETEIAALMKSAEAFVFTGAIGLSLNHALAYGLPVVAFDRVPGGPHHKPEFAYLKEGVTGLVVKSYTEDAFVKTLEQLFARGKPRLSYEDSIRSFVDQNLLLSHMVADFGQVDRFLAELGVRGA